jgi:solute carrier family 25 (mitochondrial carnitine/acylcarnitine transporter), member 20/29
MSSKDGGGSGVNDKLRSAVPAPVADKLPHVPETRDELKTELKAEAKAAASSFSSQIRSLAAGGFGGICAVVVGHPFDLVKVRLQTAERGVYSSAIDVVRKSIARDGLRRGLYAGVSAPLVGVTPMCEFDAPQTPSTPVGYVSLRGSR